VENRVAKVLNIENTNMEYSIQLKEIQNQIFTIRGVQVMVDRDLAEMYKVETRALNQAVKRNMDRFPESFRFQLTEKEFDHWKSQIVMSIEDKMGLRKLPYVFTEQGVSMLSAVLRSDTAVQVSIAIINAFVEMRKFISYNASVFQRLDNIEIKLLDTDYKFEKIFKALESKEVIPNQGIFFDGQIFDAYKFASDIICSAKKSIVVIDNYIDDSVLTLLSKKNEKVFCTILTKTISEQLKLGVAKFTNQYGQLSVKQFDKSHDRFLIIDNETVYHFGASLKDLGKKWFAFSKMDKDSVTIINEINRLGIQ
jgi:hypothetical protein